MDGASTPTAAVLVIGNEILSGRTRDSNLHYLGGQLEALGIRLAEARVVPDEQPAIVEALNALRERWDYVFTTGGIGPTHDDITTDAVAHAFGVEVERNAEAVARLARHYASPAELTEARLRMARIPVGAQLLDNPLSGAPGFRLGNVHVLPGVPSIMQAMFEAMRHRLAGGPPILSLAVSAELGESRIAAGLEAVQGRYPELAIGSYPFARGDRFGVQVVVRGLDAGRLAAAREEVAAVMRAAGAEPTLAKP